MAISKIKKKSRLKSKLKSKKRPKRDFTKNKNVKFFLKTVKDQCRRCRVKLIFAESNTVGEKGFGGLYGYFLNPSKAKGEIKIAIKDIEPKEWIYTLAHEYAHFLQWFNNDPIFNSKNYLKLEIETEKQAIKILRKFKIPLNFTLIKKQSKRYINELSSFNDE
jgi:Zn-dependent peptidase ImmA (M78 family)